MTLHVSRRLALTAMVGAVTGLTVPLPAAADPTLVRVSTVPLFDVAPMYAADAQGYFGAENIAVTTQAMQSGVFGIPALVAGAYEVAYSNSTSVISAIDRGIDLRIIIEGTLNGPTPPGPGVLFKRKGDPFKTGKDFEGRSIAVNGLRNVMWLVTRSWVKATGGDPDKVDYREVPLPAMLDALKNKQVDGAVALDPFMTVGLSDPNTFEIIDYPFGRVYANGATAFWVVMGQTATQRPGLVRAFVRAYKRGATWVNSNLGKEAYFQLVSSYTRMEVQLVRKMALFPAATEIVVESIAKLQQLMVENGMLAKPIDIKSRIFS